MTRKRYPVLFSASARRDILAIHAYVAANASSSEADALISSLLDAAEGLAEFPDRGAIPAELAALGEKRYRQILKTPYRIIYKHGSADVRIHLVAHGKRDMQSLLAERLLAR